MAISFNQQKGSAQKSSISAYQYVDGDNKIRLCGDILARYVYWVEGENKKNIPLECLSFDRNEERFNNKEQDWVKKYYPDLKCNWSYATQGIINGEVKVVNLKKKLWEQINIAAEDLGDPTDPETGWDIIFKRAKTGPLPYNVAYQLQPLKCKPRALNETESALFKEIKSMEDVMPRPTPDAQKELLDRIRQKDVAEIDETIEDEFNVA
ncbi:MAG: hypothetical protein CMI58_00110 [Parcubacteria group bacterium]|jgi:hypothetical protein|nr:hypothetical protein [Parcubacteria group bacterium]